MSMKLWQGTRLTAQVDGYLALTQPELVQNSWPTLPYQKASTIVIPETIFP